MSEQARFTSFTRGMNDDKVRPVLAGSYTEINREILLATLEAFSKRGFCGDLHFTFESRQILRVVAEIHHADLVSPMNYHEIVNQHRAAVDMWLTLPSTVFVVYFNQGRITKVQTHDHAYPEQGRALTTGGGESPNQGQ